VRRRLFLAAVVLHGLVLLGWAGALERERATATPIRLAVVQRDPRDLLRGDYVTLNYAISDVPLHLFAGPRPSSGGRRVWVLLEPRGAVWEAVAASLERARLSLAPGQRVIVGTLLWGGPRGARVEYGIERYYVPEGKGTPPGGRIEAEVRLTADGRPHLARLFVDGRPYP